MEKTDLVTALEEALEGMREMIPYVPDYFIAKHDLYMYIVHAEVTLEKVKEN
jgi:hypothetical protein